MQQAGKRASPGKEAPGIGSAVTMMNAQKFTQKSMEAVQSAQDIALSRSGMRIEQCHLLLALLTQEQGLIPQLLARLPVDVPAFTREAERLADSLPGVSGPGREAGKISDIVHA